MDTFVRTTLPVVGASIGKTVAAILLLLAFPQAGSQPRPVLTFMQVPAYGQSGELTGELSGINAAGLNLYIFEFIPDIGWVWPTCQPVPIAGNGSFRISFGEALERFATRYSAYLVPASISPECSSRVVAVPFSVIRNAIASVTIPRLVQQRTLSFSGMEWYVKSPPLRVYPGPQYFDEANAFVDPLGRLHLRVRRCGDSWCAAEIYTKERVGYGTYSFTVDQPLNDIDRNLTLGMFTWDAQASDRNYREWDVEFSRWGDPNATANAQYVVQPYEAPGNMLRFLMSSAASSTTEVTWAPNQILFRTVSGSGAPIAQWSSAGSTPIPNTGSAHLHLNFYVGAGGAPAVATDREIIISRMNYLPAFAADRIQFNRNAAVLWKQHE
jgi:hypothetical protein